MKGNGGCHRRANQVERFTPVALMKITFPKVNSTTATVVVVAVIIIIEVGALNDGRSEKRGSMPTLTEPVYPCPRRRLAATTWKNAIVIAMMNLLNGF